MAVPGNSASQNTSYKVVLPFYIYAAVSFLVSTLLLLFSTNAFTQHYFHPHTLAITHVMALGWGTMMILGASYQLVPVLIEHKLYSDKLALISFYIAGIGIPLLAYGFYTFDMQWPAKTGGILINIAVILFMVNVYKTISDRNKQNVHAIFMLAATGWLLLTTIVGLLLVYNFSWNILSDDSLHYLPFHAHLGIVGWFLLLVIGVGSRLIPMFLISKYSNEKLLWGIFSALNIGLGIFVVLFLIGSEVYWYLIPVLCIVSGIAMFVYYCYKAFKERIRRQVDEPMKISLLSVGIMVLAVLLVGLLIAFLIVPARGSTIVLVYGFSIFFGWITALIFGMTFKTLPFIIWNKVYHKMAGKVKTPNPKDLFSTPVFNAMAITYVAGFILFMVGVLTIKILILQMATVLLLVAAFLYNWNVAKLVMHKS